MDKLQVFSEKLNSPITIGTISGRKDINNKNYYESWTNGGWSNSGSTWINDGWSNSGSNWINDGWSNSGSNWINDGWSNSGSNWINGGWSNGAGGGSGGWYNDSGSGGSGGGWHNGSGGGGGKGSEPEHMFKLLKNAAVAILILIVLAMIRMAFSGELDIKFLRGSDYIGAWSYDSINYTSDGVIYNDAENFYLPCNYVINKDGTFNMELNGEDASGSWTKSEEYGETVLFLTYDEGTSSEIESLIQDNVIYYIRTNNMMEVYERKGDMFFVLNGYDPEETAYVLFRKE